MFKIKFIKELELCLRRESISNVSARIWNVIITNIDVNISFIQFKIVLKYSLNQ